MFINVDMYNMENAMDRDKKTDYKTSSSSPPRIYTYYIYIIAYYYHIIVLFFCSL